MHKPWMWGPQEASRPVRPLARVGRFRWAQLWAAPCCGHRGNAAETELDDSATRGLFITGPPRAEAAAEPPTQHLGWPRAPRRDSVVGPRLAWWPLSLGLGVLGSPRPLWLEQVPVLCDGRA